MERITVKSTDLYEVCNAIDRVYANCQDYICPSLDRSRVRFNEKQRRFEFSFYDELSKPREMLLTDFSMSQLCGKIGVPFQYVEKCVQRDETWALELVLGNLNTWISKTESTPLLVRGYGDSIRGLLTTRYSVFDAPDVMEGVMRGFDKSMNDFSVEGYWVTPERVHVRVVKKTPLEGLGEDLFAGLIIDCSDVGEGAITIGIFLFKQVCTNGLIVRKLQGVSFRQIHRGAISGIRSNVVGCIAGLGQYERLMSTMIKKAKSVDYKSILCMDDNLVEVTSLFQQVKAISGLSKKKTKEVFDIALTVYDSSAWGLINALTQVAQDYSLDKRLLIEEAAGQYLMQLYVRRDVQSLLKEISN